MIPLSSYYEERGSKLKNSFHIAQLFPRMIDHNPLEHSTFNMKPAASFVCLEKSLKHGYDSSTFL
jgi:hypothetical protein